MWLDEHYKELSKELQKFANDIINNNTKDFRGKVETCVIKYDCYKNTINTTMFKILKDTIKNNKNCLQHLMHGYKDIYNNIGSLFNTEGKYRYQLNEAINDLIVSNT